ncbi:MAG: LuxR C-terminal-related transcriptional regulator [Flavobacteriales bacterium]|nr:LuxR C-terminal-related transcriptional regulator [Flavobacteriales bacterium]
MNNKKSILVVHPQKIVRDILSAIISKSEGFSIAFSCKSEKQMFSVIEKGTKIDIYILSDTLNEIGILELIEKIKEKTVAPKILLYMNSSAKKMFMTMVARTNVCYGFLHPDTTEKGLIDALDCVSNGGFVLDGYMDDGLEKKKTRRYDLSEKEQEVFSLIVSGYRLVDISMKMGIDAKTVSTYKNRICHKLGVSSNFELISKFYSVL